jgi:hypothetical protein
MIVLRCFTLKSGLASSIDRLQPRWTKAATAESQAANAPQKARLRRRGRANGGPHFAGG